MFIKARPIVRELDNKTILQHFLKQLHQRQSHHLARIPKILLDRDWFHRVVLWANLTQDINRTVPLSQFEHEVIIPMVDEILSWIERKATDCDAIIFHQLPLSENINGHRESLDGVSARIATAVDFGMRIVVSRIDIAFTPMWLRKATKSRLYYIGEG